MFLYKNEQSIHHCSFGYCGNLWCKCYDMVSCKAETTRIMWRETAQPRTQYIRKQRKKKKHFVIAIDLTKSPSDGVAGGEVSFTGEHMRTSLATIQQKSCTLAGANPRIFMCLRYDAIVEVSAGGCDLLTWKLVIIIKLAASYPGSRQS